MSADQQMGNLASALLRRHIRNRRRRQDEAVVEALLNPVDGPKWEPPLLYPGTGLPFRGAPEPPWRGVRMKDVEIHWTFSRAEIESADLAAEQAFRRLAFGLEGEVSL